MNDPNDEIDEEGDRQLLEMRLDHLYRRQVKKMDQSEEILQLEIEEVRRRKQVIQEGINRALRVQEKLKKEKEHEKQLLQQEKDIIANYFYENAKDEEQWRAELEKSETTHVNEKKEGKKTATTTTRPVNNTKKSINSSSKPVKKIATTTKAKKVVK